MKAWIIGALLGGFTSQMVLGGQLYLLTGMPTGAYLGSHYRSAILKIDSGTVSSATEVVPGDIGTDWTGISYDFRKAIVLSNEMNVYVIDLDSAAVVKKCPGPRGGYLIEQWLADVPGRGNAFEWHTGSGQNDLYQSLA